MILTQKKKVAGYCRVSTNMQSTGLESQVRVIKIYFEQNNITDYEIFLDENVSGTKSSRPGLDRLMQAVRDNQISMVVVPAFSRFARSTTHLLNALSEFKVKNVGFVSLSEKIDTSTPVGIAIFSILAAVSQLERDLIAERVRVGLQNARAKGKHIGRKKLRDSDLIRKLLKAKVTYRRIAEIAKCSHGAVHAEKVAIKKEEEIARQKKLEDVQQVQTSIESAIDEAKTKTDPEDDHISLYF
ncbi:MAG: recombinase family protein [Bdellovibrionales bacterium]